MGEELLNWALREATIQALWSGPAFEAPITLYLPGPCWLPLLRSLSLGRPLAAPQLSKLREKEWPGQEVEGSKGAGQTQ